MRACSIIHSSVTSSQIKYIQLPAHLPSYQHLALPLQIFKHYMKSDASDYGEGTTLMRATSRKRAQRTDRQQEAAVQADAAAADEAAGLECRNTDAGTPFLAEGVSPGTLLTTSPSVGRTAKSCLHLLGLV